jgi:hypothetical protein
VESITQSSPLAQTTSSSLPALWVGILAGPVAWACDEVIGYSITAHECSTGSMRGLHSLTVVSFCLCILGGLCARNGRPDGSADGTRAERQRVMAIAGMILSIAFAVAILATGIPKWMLSPCD